VSKYQKATATIELMARRLDEAANDLREMARVMREQDDGGQASDVASAIINLAGSLPLDRLFNEVRSAEIEERLLREMEKG